MTPILSARGLTKGYPGATSPALDNVSIDVFPGQSLAIMGASGSGKTTLLHTLSGILPPTAGTVTFHPTANPMLANQTLASQLPASAAKNPAVRIDQLSDAERSRLRREHFGFVFQQGLLLNELTALENVAIALMLTGTPRPQAEQQALRWLQYLGLNGMEDRRLGQLSGGQAQRIAIARAQVTGAQLLFADEPTGSLDSNTGQEVMSVLLSAVATGKTLVLVTHNAELAAQCDRIVTLHDGRIEHDTATMKAAQPSHQLAAPEMATAAAGGAAR